MEVINTIGRRKTSVARLYMESGKGVFNVNGKTLEDYFPSDVLQIIVNPYMVMTNEYVIEITYNISMLLVLTSSLLSYLYRDDRKSLLMFLGSLSIVFSEVIGVAYLYVAQQNLLSFLTTSLTLLAFYFYCKQSSLVNEEVNQFAS